jgi:hypothetical protein
MVDGKRVPLLSASRLVVKQYFALLFAWLISYGLFALTLKVMLPIVARNAWVRFGSTFAIGLLIQALVAFLLPAILILRKGFFKGICEGFKFGVKNILRASALIALPMLLVLVLSFFKLFTPLYIKIHPELVLWLLGGGIVIMTLVDFWVTTSTTVLYLRENGEKP